MQGIAAGCAEGLIHRYFGIIRSVSAECGAY